MPRIRSVHPGWFTDEIWVTVSPMARLLGVGIWTECDDQGIFEWKPVTLKMRLFPVDNILIGDVLEELRAADLVRYFEHEGRHYGAVRNFARYQRPKKPRALYFIPREFRTYVALDGPSSELDDAEASSVPQMGERDPLEAPPVPQKAEMAPQMERRGEKSSSVADATGAEAPLRPPADPVELLWHDGPGELQAMGVPDRQARTTIGRWLRDTGGDAARVLAAIQRARDHGTRDPVPLVGRLLRPVSSRSPPHADQDRSVQAAARALERWAREREAGDVPAIGGG